MRTTTDKATAIGLLICSVVWCLSVATIPCRLKQTRRLISSVPAVAPDGLRESAHVADQSLELHDPGLPTDGTPDPRMSHPDVERILDRILQQMIRDAAPEELSPDYRPHHGFRCGVKSLLSQYQFANGD